MMRVTNDRAVGRRRWNWFDLFLAVAFLLAILGAFWIARQGLGRRDAELRQYSYTVLLSGMETSAAEQLLSCVARNGGGIRNENGTRTLGVTSEIRRAPHVEAVVRSGELTFAEIVGREDVRIVILTDATHRRGDGVRVGDIRIAAGDVLNLRIGGFWARGVLVTSVEEVLASDA